MFKCKLVGVVTAFLVESVVFQDDGSYLLCPQAGKGEPTLITKELFSRHNQLFREECNAVYLVDASGGEHIISAHLFRSLFELTPMSAGAQLDREIEIKCNELELTAPKVDAAEIDKLVDSLVIDYYVVPNTTTTMAVAINENGFTIATGMAACVSPENFNREVGQDIAKRAAIDKARDELWRLEGYALSKLITIQDGIKILGVDLYDDSNS